MGHSKLPPKTVKCLVRLLERVDKRSPVHRAARFFHPHVMTWAQRHQEDTTEKGGKSGTWAAALPWRAKGQTSFDAEGAFTRELCSYHVGDLNRLGDQTAIDTNMIVQGACDASQQNLDLDKNPKREYSIPARDLAFRLMATSFHAASSLTRKTYRLYTRKLFPVLMATEGSTDGDDDDGLRGFISQVLGKAAHHTKEDFSLGALAAISQLYIFIQYLPVWHLPHCKSHYGLAPYPFTLFIASSLTCVLFTSFTHAFKFCREIVRFVQGAAAADALNHAITHAHKFVNGSVLSFFDVSHTKSKALIDLVTAFCSGTMQVTRFAQDCVMWISDVFLQCFSRNPSALIQCATTNVEAIQRVALDSVPDVVPSPLRSMTSSALSIVLNPFVTTMQQLSSSAVEYIFASVSTIFDYLTSEALSQIQMWTQGNAFAAAVGSAIARGSSMREGGLLAFVGVLHEIATKDKVNVQVAGYVSPCFHGSLTSLKQKLDCIFALILTERFKKHEKDAAHKNVHKDKHDVVHKQAS